MVRCTEFGKLVHNNVSLKWVTAEAATHSNLVMPPTFPCAKSFETRTPSAVHAMSTSTLITPEHETGPISSDAGNGTASFVVRCTEFGNLVYNNVLLKWVTAEAATHSDSVVPLAFSCVELYDTQTPFAVHAGRKSTLITPEHETGPASSVASNGTAPFLAECTEFGNLVYNNDSLKWVTAGAVLYSDLSVPLASTHVEPFDTRTPPAAHAMRASILITPEHETDPTCSVAGNGTDSFLVRCTEFGNLVYNNVSLKWVTAEAATHLDLVMPLSGCPFGLSSNGTLGYVDTLQPSGSPLHQVQVNCNLTLVGQWTLCQYVQYFF